MPTQGLFFGRKALFLAPRRSVFRRIALFLAFLPTLLFASVPEGPKSPMDSLKIAADALPDTAVRSRLAPWSFGVSANVSGLLPMDDICKAIMHNYGCSLYGVYADYHTSAADGNAYDADFGYPTLEGGFLFGDYHHIRFFRDEPRLDYNSGMGYMLALYGGFRRDLFRSKSWALGYNFENGIGFCTRPYNTRTNADNEIIGSTYNIYLDIGFYAKYRFAKHWEAALGIDYKHFSNGALDRPNKGANTAGITARLNYYPEAFGDPEPVNPDVQEPFRKRFYVELSAGLAAKSLQDDWVINYWMRDPSDPKYRSSRFPVYGAFTAMVAPMYRYCRRYASGLELDYTYAPYASRIEELDHWRNLYQYKYSRHVLGIGFRHEVFFRHLSLAMGAGWYVFRRMGYTADVDEKPYYETIGLRYNFPFSGDRLFIGYNVKAHFTKADCMQVTLGWRFGPKAE